MVSRINMIRTFNLP